MSMMITRQLSSSEGEVSVTFPLTREELKAAFYEYQMIQDKEMVFEYLAKLEKEHLAKFGIYNNKSMECAAKEIATIMRFRADENSTKNNPIADILNEVLDTYRFAL